MKIQKKTIASEIIIFFSALGLILLFFVGTEVYNWTLNRKIANRDESISSTYLRIYSNTYIIDSLQNTRKAKNPYFGNNTEVEILTNPIETTVFSDSITEVQIKKYSDIRDKKQQEKLNLESEREDYKRSLLNAEEQKKMTLNFALVLFSLVYLLRGLILTLKWSINTLKEG